MTTSTITVTVTVIRPSRERYSMHAACPSSPISVFFDPSTVNPSVNSYTMCRHPIALQVQVPSTPKRTSRFDLGTLFIRRAGWVRARRDPRDNANVKVGW